MNLSKLTLLGGLLFAVISTPLASAQNRGGARISTPSASFASSAPRSSLGSGGSRSVAVQPRTGVARSGRTGNWANGHGGHWNHNGGHWGHRHHFFYPYYGYYPFGFGSPFWGSSYYYNGYDSNYAGEGRGSGSLVANVQQELAEAGYYRGTIDGVIGNQTRSAIRAYERANRLPIDGRIDAELLSTMGLG